MVTSQLSKILPIIYAIIGFGALILVHEFGHFIFCKIFGIDTPTFSIGMGPKIFQKKIGNTNFRISAIPIGGYVEIAGMQEVGQGEQKQAKDEGKRSFSSKPYWQKFLVLTGGVGFNLLFAYVALIALFLVGAPTKPEILIKSIVEGSPAAQAGLMTEDRILRIDDSEIEKEPELLGKIIKKIQNPTTKEITFVVYRNGSIKEMKVSLPSIEATNKKEEISSEGKPRLGVQFDFGFSDQREKLPFIAAVKKGIITTNGYIKQTAFMLKELFKRRSLKGVGGPVLILSESAKYAKQGMVYLLIFLAIISISLAFMNLLPLPVLDGGQLVFVTIESIIGREIPMSIKNAIHLASIALLLGLVLYVTYNDILHLMKK